MAEDLLEALGAYLRNPDSALAGNWYHLAP
jgi:hypothetical protein